MHQKQFSNGHVTNNQCFLPYTAIYCTSALCFHSWDSACTITVSVQRESVHTGLWKSIKANNCSISMCLFFFSPTKDEVTWYQWIRSKDEVGNAALLFLIRVSKHFPLSIYQIFQQFIHITVKPENVQTTWRLETRRLTRTNEHCQQKPHCPYSPILQAARPVTRWMYFPLVH